MNTMYYNEDDGWGAAAPKKSKKEKKELTPQTPEKQIIELKRLLEQSNSERDRVRRDLDQVVADHRKMCKKLRELEHYKPLYEEATAKFEGLKEKVTSVEKKFTEVQSMVDGAMERAMIAETDVAEMKHNNVLKDGMLRSLRGFFSPQGKEFFFRPHSFNQRETASILEIIDKGLNPDKIKCQKSFKHI